MSQFIRTVLVLSAFSPVLFSLAFIRYGEHGFTAEVASLVMIGTLGSLLPYLILRELAKRAEVIPFRAKKVEPTDFMLIVFVASYVVPFVGRVAGLDFAHIIIAIGVFAALCWYVQSVPAHPVLRLLFRVRFYKVESESGMVYTLLAREEIRAPTQIAGVQVISSTMLFKPN